MQKKQQFILFLNNKAVQIMHIFNHGQGKR